MLRQTQSNSDNFKSNHVSLDDLRGPVWETLLELQAEGKIKYLGMCTTGSEVTSIRDALETLPIDVIQSSYNVLNPTEGRVPPAGFDGQDYGQTFDIAREKAIGVVGYRALAGGALTQQPDASTRPTPSRGNDAWSADIERARALGFLKGDGEQTLAGAAVRYALTNPAVSSLLLGFSKKRYIDEANEYSEAGPIPATPLPDWNPFTHLISVGVPERPCPTSCTA